MDWKNNDIYAKTFSKNLNINIKININKCYIFY
jgi:hypothetical protein